MDKLPIFPLNTTLFPLIPLRLHIFEPRYQEMISHCIDEKINFGIVQIRAGQEAGKKIARIFSIGCTASILNVENLADGKMNILLSGKERFKILEEFRDGIYLEANVEFLSFNQGNTKKIVAAANDLRPWVSKYLQILKQVNLYHGEANQLPRDPLELAYLSASLLQSSPKNKQAILQESDLEQLLIKTRDLYRVEIPLAKKLIRTPSPKNGFNSSLN